MPGRKTTKQGGAQKGSTKAAAAAATAAAADPVDPPADGEEVLPWLRRHLIRAVFALKERKAQDAGRIFSQPTHTIPNYRQKIADPIDLTEISKRANNQYTSVEEFEADIILMEKNCIEFNGPDAHFVAVARTVVEIARTSLRKIQQVLQAAEATGGSVAEQAAELRQSAAQRLRTHPVVKSGVYRPQLLTEADAAVAAAAAAAAVPTTTAAGASVTSAPAAEASSVPAASVADAGASAAPAGGPQRLERSVSLPANLHSHLLMEAADPGAREVARRRGCAWPVDLILREFLSRVCVWEEGGGGGAEASASYAVYATAVSQMVNNNISALLYPEELRAHRGAAGGEADGAEIPPPSETYGAPVLARLLAGLPQSMGAAAAQQLPPAQHNALILASEELAAFVGMNWDVFWPAASG